MTQTAVEWFNQQIVDRQNGNGDSRTWDEIFSQAKEMEKAEKEKFDNMLSMLEEAYRRLENTNMVSLRKEIKETINETFKPE
jgi:hypothetical protein